MNLKDSLRRDIVLLFSTRIVRLFAYGFLSVILALYLIEIGLTDAEVGLLFTLTLAGDAVITLSLTTHADRFGRRRTLRIGALLMMLAGLAFILTREPVLLMAAAIVGVISPSGNEIGPFLSVEQAALSQLLPDRDRTKVFAWYNLAGSFATASGALVSGWLVQLLRANGWTAVNAYRGVLSGYGLAGCALLVIFFYLSAAVEPPKITNGQPTVLGLHKSRGVVLRLSSLFALDAFAGGFIVQSMLAYWFHLRFDVDTGLLGSIFFAANLLAGISALLAARIAKKIGLIRTMVFTHLPSNVLLLLIPLMPNLPLAIGLLLVRFAISQMDVPTRQSYTIAVVDPDERSAAAGVTSIARSVGASISPTLTGLMIASPALISMPIILAGGLKIIYDLALYINFKQLKPPEE